jgi:hypothetical protein
VPRSRKLEYLIKRMMRMMRRRRQLTRKSLMVFPLLALKRSKQTFLTMTQTRKKKKLSR